MSRRVVPEIGGWQLGPRGPLPPATEGEVRAEGALLPLEAGRPRRPLAGVLQVEDGRRHIQPQPQDTGAAALGKRAEPGDAGLGGRAERRPRRRAEAAASSTWAGEVSPRKRSVRWMPSGRTRRTAPSRGRRPACSSPIASRSGGSSSIATNARAVSVALTAAAGPAGPGAASRAPPAWPGSARARGRRGRGCGARACPPRRRWRRTRGPRASRRCPRPGPRSR